MSIIAIALALGTGGAWAAGTLNGGTIQDKTLSGKKLKTDTLTGVQVKESKLKEVPKGKSARLLGGKPASAFLPATATATDSARLGGVAAAGYAKGNGIVQNGSAALSSTSTTSAQRDLDTPAGRFRLSCSQSTFGPATTTFGRALYLNQPTAGTATLWVTTLDRGPDEPAIDGTAETEYSTVAAGQTAAGWLGAQALSAVGSTFPDIVTGRLTASKGASGADLAIAIWATASSCQFSWTLTRS